MAMAMLIDTRNYLRLFVAKRRINKIVVWIARFLSLDTLIRCVGDFRKLMSARLIHMDGFAIVGAFMLVSVGIAATGDYFLRRHFRNEEAGHE